MPPIKNVLSINVTKHARITLSLDFGHKITESIKPRHSFSVRSAAFGSLTYMLKTEETTLSNMHSQNLIGFAFNFMQLSVSLQIIYEVNILTKIVSSIYISITNISIKKHEFF